MPRGLGMADLPYLGTPNWTHWARPNMDSAYEWNAGERVAIEVSPFEALATADEVICISGQTPVEAHSAAMLMAHASGSCMTGDAYAALERIGDPGEGDSPPFPEVRYLPVDSIKPVDALENWNKGLTTRSDEFLKLVSRQCCIRFFNAAFRVNSIMLLDPILRKLSPAYEGGMIAPSSLQLLYVIAESDGMSTDRMTRMMIEWKGTGRHPQVALGNESTRHQIIENLANAGLIRISNRMYTASALGTSYLAQMHKDCRDVDQAARLEAWSHEWPASRPAVEKYLRTFFGKQKRVNGRSDA